MRVLECEAAKRIQVLLSQSSYLRSFVSTHPYPITTSIRFSTASYPFRLQPPLGSTFSDSRKFSTSYAPAGCRLDIQTSRAERLSLVLVHSLLIGSRRPRDPVIQNVPWRWRTMGSNSSFFHGQRHWSHGEYLFLSALH